MSNDTTVFVMADPKDTMEIIQAVTKSINKMVSEKLNKHLENIGANKIAFIYGAYEKHDSEKWTASARIHSNDFKIFQIIFGIGDGDKKSANRRVLWINTDCSFDYSDTHDGNKIIFSTDSWGSHVDIMKVVIKALNGFGDIYYRKNENDDFMRVK